MSVLCAPTAKEPEAVADLLPQIYDELRCLADYYLRSDRVDHTLEPTALVHETYLWLSQTQCLQWQDLSHFYRIAARTMRRILVDHALRRRRVKRGGDRKKLHLDHAGLCQHDRDVDLIDLDHSLTRLNTIDEQK